MEGSYPRDLAVVGNSVFFNASGQIWTSDGTEEGTRQLEGGAGGQARNLTDVDGTLYFLVDVYGSERPGLIGDRELWKTDSSIQGTVLRFLVGFPMSERQTVIADPFMQNEIDVGAACEFTLRLLNKRREEGGLPRWLTLTWTETGTF